jgi:hypothetical protein
MTSRLLALVLWSAVALAAGVAALQTARTTPFAIDELQHAHLAWNLHEGRWPYRDFYEHHGLVLTLLNALVLHGRGADAASFNALVWLRGWTLAALAGQAVVVRQLAWRWSKDAVVAAMASALLLASGLVTEVGTQVRPDTLQTLFVLLGALALVDRRPMRAGAWLGLALATHPKAVVAVVAVVAGAVAEGWPWDRALLRRWALRLLPGLAAPTTLVALLYAALGGLRAWLEAGIVSNMRLLADRWLNDRLHPQTQRWLWTHDAAMTAVLLLGLALLFNGVLRRRPSAEGARFLTVASLLLVPLVLVPLYPQLLLVVVPFLALAASHASLPIGWRWVALAVTTSVVLLRWQATPDSETPPRTAQRTMVNWMLDHTSREAAVVEVWPTDCPAFVFQRDPGWQWMLAANDAYAPGGTPTSGQLDRILREEVMSGRIDHVVSDAADDPFLPPDIRAYLKSEFEPRGCVRVRRSKGSEAPERPSTTHD